MKKTILIIAIALGAINVQAQTDSAYVYYWEDTMEDKTYYMTSYDLVVANEDRSRGAKLTIHLTGDKFGFLTAKLIGLGNCVEDNKIIILFEDGTKINLASWNDFNCDGNAYLNLTPEQLTKLTTLEVKTIRVTNGYNHNSVTSSEITNPRYFIQLIYAINNKLFTLLED